MPNESAVPEAPRALPWTAFNLGALEAIVAWQQQAWQQWFRIFTAFTPSGLLPADPVNAAEAGGLFEAASEAAAQRTQRAVQTAARRRAPPREHANADAGAPRRGAGTSGRRGSRQR